MQFSIERTKRLLSEIESLIRKDTINIVEFKCKQCDYNNMELLNEEPSIVNGWSNFKCGFNRWEGKDAHYWFKTDIEIPENYSRKSVIFTIKTGHEGGWDASNPQFLVYIDGQVTQGVDVNHTEVLISNDAKGGRKYSIALYAYTGMEIKFCDLACSISILEKEIEKLYYDIKVPLEVAELLDNNDIKRIDILKYINNTINFIDFRKYYSEGFYTSISEAGRYITEEFYNKYCGEGEVTELCVGHTHIDVAWLWTLAQTREKIARTFSTVLKLMEEYPEYRFMSSQPQLYKYLKEDHPQVYEKVKEKVANGVWETEGAMWLEADCNISSGESLVRQVLFGKRFFKKEFNKDNRILWLPDVFGYSAALPQILKKSGVDYFMTTKISWNEYNKMPYDTFKWRGIDGTEVLTHFISTTDYKKNGRVETGTTYNGNTNPSQVMGCWQRYQQKDINTEVLNCFGHGDGGGGATKAMLENLRRLDKGIPGAPTTKHGTALEFFNRLDDKVKDTKYLPKWVGELYLEYHRGTYTTMARNKKLNRKSEYLNQDAESLCILNNLLTKQEEYPQEKLNKCWETTLLNQFHDIIPGSSIKEVYEESKKDYEKIIGITKEIIDTTLNNIVVNINLDKTSVVVFNQLGFTRNDIVEVDLPQGWISAKILYKGVQIPCQISQNKVIFYGENIPSKGYKTFVIEKFDENNDKLIKRDIVDNKIENKYFSIGFDKDYNIVSIYDKINEREVLKGKGNALLAFEDKPHNYDAWDINIYYQEKMWEVNNVQSVEVIEKGPVRTTLRIERKFSDSTIVQYMKVYNSIPRIDFYNEIDWKENQVLLKVAFPVDIHSDKATYEIQYGNVERDTHWNTSWDYAKFEVCAHKWADLSEGDYGVALLNDCKYGHDIKDSVIRLSLLKSATYPNPEADKETHRFTYSLYPHKGQWKNSNVVNMAYNLNCPMYGIISEPHKGTLPTELSIISIDKENVIIEVVKKAEDSNDIIVRMYEFQNKRSKVVCSLLSSIEEANECNLLEENLLESDIKVEDKSFTFIIKPFEIKTFKIKVK